MNIHQTIRKIERTSNDLIELVEVLGHVFCWSGAPKSEAVANDVKIWMQQMIEIILRDEPMVTERIKMAKRMDRLRNLIASSPENQDLLDLSIFAPDHVANILSALETLEAFGEKVAEATTEEEEVKAKAEAKVKQ